MHPKLAERFKNDPELRAFVEYLQEECAKLKQTKEYTLDLSDAIIARDVLAKNYAYEVLVSILDPLLNPQVLSPDNKSEFAM